MAFQTSSIKLEGKIGDLSFYKVQEEYLAKKSSGPSKDQIKNSPSFERTRENAAEFGYASSFAKKLKLSLKQTLGNSYDLFRDPSQTNRFTKRMNNVVKADSVNPRGKRKVLTTNLSLFTGFSMDSSTSLKDVFFIPLTPIWLKEEGIIRLQIPTFKPSAVMDFNKKVVKFQFHLCTVSIFNNEDILPSASTQSPLLPIDQQCEQQVIDLILPNAKADCTMLFFGVSFYTLVAGYAVPFTETSQNALDVLSVFESI